MITDEMEEMPLHDSIEIMMDTNLEKVSFQSSGVTAG